MDRHRWVIYIAPAIVFAVVAIFTYLQFVHSSSQPVKTKLATIVSPTIARSPTASPTASPSATLVPTRAFVPTTPVKPSGKLNDVAWSLGIGEGHSSGDWVNIPTIRTELDRAEFDPVFGVTFQSTVLLYKGKEQDATIRVFNETANHAVAGTELFFPSGDKSRFMQSGPITLDPGKNVYRVQIKTQFDDNAVVNSAVFVIKTYSR